MRFPVFFWRFKFYKRVTKSISLLALASLVCACSAVKIAYNQAPDLAYWYLDGYLDFTGTQSLQVKGELNRLQSWHRQTQLPSYVELLQKLQQQMPSELDATLSCQIYGDARRKLMLVTEQALPAMATLAQTLDASQLEKMEQKFAKGNTDYREDFIEATPKASRNKRYKQAVSRAEMLYGRLEESQLNLIGQRIDQSHFDAKMFYGERLRRQKDTLQTLRSLLGSQAGPDKIRAGLRPLMGRTFDSPNTAYRQYLDQVTQDNCQMFSALHSSTSTAQRREAVKTLKAYEQDLAVLVAQNFAATP